MYSINWGPSGERLPRHTLAYRENIAWSWIHWMRSFRQAWLEICLNRYSFNWSCIDQTWSRLFLSLLKESMSEKGGVCGWVCLLLKEKWRKKKIVPERILHFVYQVILGAERKSGVISIFQRWCELTQKYKRTATYNKLNGENGISSVDGRNDLKLHSWKQKCS